MNNKIIIGLVGVILIVATALFIWFNQSSSQLSITNFEECVAAGNPVMESYPEQCRAADGRLFVKELVNDNVNIEIPASVLDEVRMILVQRLSVDEDKVSIVGAIAQDWSDACLGMGGADEICAQMITPGYRITAEVDGLEYIYRTSEDGNIIREERE